MVHLEAAADDLLGVIGAALLGAGFLGHALAHTLWAHMLAVAVWTVGEIIAYGISKTIISDLGPPAQRGTYIGLVGSMAGLATLLAPLIGGALLAFYAVSMIVAPPPPSESVH